MIKSGALKLTLAKSLMQASSRSYQTVYSTRKIIPIYPPIEKASIKSNAALIQNLCKEELKNKLDIDGWRSNLLSKHNKDGLKVGDIVRVLYNQDKCKFDNFVGYILSIDRKTNMQDASLLLRNQVTKVMVEVRIPIFSPLIERIDILRKSNGLRKRNKHYYIRGTKLDVGSLESKLRKKK